MPKVSEEHLEQRREQILEAAQYCFARTGFHQTSMQDVFAQSGLSAGAVYRYFKSKDDIIKAIAGRSLERIEPIVKEVLAEDPIPPLEDAIVRFISEIMALEDGPMKIFPQVLAAAIYDPNVAAYATEIMTRIRGWWIDLARATRDAGRLPPDADVQAVGSVLFGLIPGFVFQHLILGDVTPETLRRGIRDLIASSL